MDERFWNPGRGRNGQNMKGFSLISGCVYRYSSRFEDFHSSLEYEKPLRNLHMNPLGRGKNRGEAEEPTNSQVGSAQTLLGVIP